MHLTYMSSYQVWQMFDRKMAATVFIGKAEHIKSWCVYVDQSIVIRLLNYLEKVEIVQNIYESCYVSCFKFL